MSFVTYRRFTEPEQARALAGLLIEKGLHCQVEEDTVGLDSQFGGLTIPKNFYVKLRKEDFPAADGFLLEETDLQLQALDKDHYLFDFSDEELFDILVKPDEWNEFDYQAAQKILIARGKEINKDVIDLLKSQRVRELAKPEEGHKSWIYAGYIFSMLGGLFGIFIGLHICTFKKTLPNGERVQED